MHPAFDHACPQINGLSPGHYGHKDFAMHHPVERAMFNRGRNMAKVHRFFCRSSKVVKTNSHHGYLWAAYAGRNVPLDQGSLFSEKFQLLPLKASDANTERGALQECRNQNTRFYEGHARVLFTARATMPRAPKIIHHTWKTAKLPAKQQTWRDKCIDLNPDWEFKLWTDADNAALVQTLYPIETIKT